MARGHRGRDCRDTLIHMNGDSVWSQYGGGRGERDPTRLLFNASVAAVASVLCVEPTQVAILTFAGVPAG